MKKKIFSNWWGWFYWKSFVRKVVKNANVIVFDNLYQGNKLNINKNIKLVKCDVRNKKMLEKYSKNCNAIFHLAAIIGVDIVAKNKVENMNVEFDGLRNICESAKKNKIKKIIYASSSGVYGKLNYEKKVKENAIIAPNSGYAMAKRSGEIYLKNFSKENNIHCASIRLFNVYGKRQDERMVIPRFIELAKKNKNIEIYGNGKQTRDFTHINDCIKTFELLEKKLGDMKFLTPQKVVRLR